MELKTPAVLNSTQTSDKTGKSRSRATPPPSLELITRPNVGTADAAYYMDREQQTLRGWACYENGPIRPIRVNGRLAWPVSELKRILGVA